MRRSLDHHDQAPESPKKLSLAEIDEQARMLSDKPEDISAFFASVNEPYTAYLHAILGRKFNGVLDFHRIADIIQTAFMKAWAGIGSFKREESFRAWIVTIARHEAASFVRTKQNMMPTTLQSTVYEKDNGTGVELVDTLEAEDSDTEGEFLDGDVQENVRRAVLLLSEDEQFLINGLFYGGMNLEDVCSHFDLGSIPTASRFKTRTLQKLGKLLAVKI